MYDLFVTFRFIQLFDSLTHTVLLRKLCRLLIYMMFFFYIILYKFLGTIPRASSESLLNFLKCVLLMLFFDNRRHHYLILHKVVLNQVFRQQQLNVSGRILGLLHSLLYSCDKSQKELSQFGLLLVLIIASILYTFIQKQV